MKVLSGIFVLILVIITVVALSFGGELLSLKWKAYFSPKHQNIERQVFEQTRSFNEAKKQDLVKYMYEYKRADANGKEAISSVIRMSFADFKSDGLPSELQSFLYETRGF